MKKGLTKNASAIEIDPFSKFVGRLETEIEIAAHYIFGCSPTELTARIGVALIGLVPEFQFPVAHLPGMRGKTAGLHNKLRKVAVGGRTSDAKTSARVNSKGNRRGMDSSSTQKGYWAKMTPEERSQEIHRRMRLSRKNKEREAKLKESA